MKKAFEKWTPVAEIFENDTRAVFEVWGRKYIFDNSFLPTSVISDGKELLEKPITMTAEFGEKHGEWTDFYYMPFEKTDEKAIILITASCENILANATVTVEFDGFVKIELRISNDWEFSETGRSKAELSGLYMDIAVKSKYSSLFHYWPNDTTSIIPSQFAMNSGKRKDIKLPFKPYIWTGDENIGLGVFVGECDRQFIAGDDCITVSGNNTRIRFLEEAPKSWQGRRDKWIDGLNPVTYTFGFHATPVKAYSANDENYKICQITDHEILNSLNDEVVEKVKALGAKKLILHESWSVIQNYGIVKDEEKFKRFVAKCHENGIKVMVYFGYEYSTLMPDFNTNGSKYLYKNQNGNFVGGWRRKPDQRAYMVCYNGGYSDKFLERIKYVMDVYGTDGIYTDGTYVPWECANTSHGCGYTDENGKLHSTFPLLAVREHVKKLYEIVHERNGMIDTHQSTCCIMPTLAFADSYFDGENIQARLTDKNMTFLNMDAFRTEYMGRNYGIPANFVAMPNEGRSIEGLESLTLLHNVHTRAYNFKDAGYETKIWKIFDELGLDNAKWHPYWDNNISSVDAENAYTNAYETEKGLVIYAVDFVGNRVITLALPQNITKLTEKLTGKIYDVKDGKAEMVLPQSRASFFAAE